MLERRALRVGGLVPLVEQVQNGVASDKGEVFDFVALLPQPTDATTELVPLRGVARVDAREDGTQALQVVARHVVLGDHDNAHLFVRWLRGVEGRVAQLDAEGEADTRAHLVLQREGLVQIVGDDEHATTILVVCAAIHNCLLDCRGGQRVLDGLPDDARRASPAAGDRERVAVGIVRLLGQRDVPRFFDRFDSQVVATRDEGGPGHEDVVGTGHGKVDAATQPLTGQELPRRRGRGGRHQQKLGARRHRLQQPRAPVGQVVVEMDLVDDEEGRLGQVEQAIRKERSRDG